MKFNYDISIVLPGIRKENWIHIYEHVCKACKNYSFELIIVSPYQLPHELQNKYNVKYLKDLGTPTRAVHMGTLISEGKFITWLSDDAHVYEDSIDKAINLLLSKDSKDIVTMRYSEGVGHSGGCPPDGYWTAAYHGDLNLPGIERHWRISCVMLLYSEYYRYMGGVDCGYEHINMNVHDFVFRAQRNGSQIHLSPTLIMNCDFEPNRTPENSAVIAAYHENDYPLFRSMYSECNIRPIRIDLENWRNTEVVWRRRNH